jgi:glycerophosphoryl diester phosphodiesterase
MKWIILTFCSIVVLFSCTESNRASYGDDKVLDIQGHRGARGLMPENSIPGFIKALEVGVNTLELDLCVTADSQVIVSHEPYFSPDFCLMPDGSEITLSPQETNIFKMKYSEVKNWDCGSKPHQRFPGQEKMKTYKPLLSEVFSQAEDYMSKSRSKNPAAYNIELKSMKGYEGIFHPEPQVFVDLVYKEINGKVPWERVTIQSFDFRILQLFKSKYPDVQLAQLVENDLSWSKNVDSLGFKPDIYSCYYKRLDENIVSDLQQKGIKVIPWTVNEISEMKELIGWGVDGIITDYPDRAIEIL